MTCPFELTTKQMEEWVSKNYGVVPQRYRRQIRLLEMGKPNGLHSQGYDLAVEQPNLHLNYPNEYFDCIVDVLYICRNVDTDAIYREVFRLLKGGGRLFTIVPQLSCPQGLFEGIESVQFFTQEGIRRCFNGKLKYKLNSLEHTPDITKPETLRFWLVDALKVM